MTEYLTTKKVNALPRLPLEGSIDLTYRCNNNCRHCWLWIPENSPEKERELSLEEIKRIVDEARSMGCRRWYISGGEPMLRPDFPEILNYLNKNSLGNTLNTNGTLITAEIARLMKKNAVNLIALYGATAEIHDHITRRPGSFEALKQGIAYLKEAGAEFTVQVVPMTDNYHQFKEMVQLAESLSRYWRIGATWLYLSACGDPHKNREILAQRLGPDRVVELDQPDFSGDEVKDKGQGCEFNRRADDRLFAACIAARRDFHIDAYGRMSFCSFIKDPELRYDLKRGTFQNCWEEFIPSLSDMVRGGKEYIENCGACESRDECGWCAVYGYIEKKNYGAKVEYLCAVTEQKIKLKEVWRRNHRRYYRVAGITIRVEADLPITEQTYHPKFKLFEVDGPGEDNISIRHHFALPIIGREYFGKELYRRSPWAVYQKKDLWIYEVFTPHPDGDRVYQVTVFNHGFTRAGIYNHDDAAFRKGGIFTLTFFSSDQVLLAQVLADRQACFFHSSGVIFRDKGLMFIGHSDAGKSTMVKMLKGKTEVLCDERIIVRRWPGGFKIHGNWAHGEVPDVSPNSAPLRAIFFLERAEDNRIVRIQNAREITSRLLACLIKPFVTADWWEKMLSLTEQIVREIPCYSLRFDMSGEIVRKLKEL